ncbi:MAG: hypothetical protein QNJ98_00170 [Planctomycetota bacterium]|nr:hypothetical protein [Planctomycetota bacterium]
MRSLRAVLIVSGLLLCLPVGCGGGGGGGDDAISENTLVRVVFPGPTGITDQTTIRIRGTAPDASQVDGVRVDGVVATSGDGFATWEADVALAPGLNVLPVDVLQPGGAVLTAHVVVQVLSVGQYPLFVRELALDDASGRLYYIDARLQTLAAIALATGHRTLLSGGGVGAGPDFVDPEGVVLDLPNGRAFIVEGAQGSPGARRVMEVTLATGARTIVASSSVGTGPPNFNDPMALTYDPQTDTVLVADEGFNGLISFDPDNGNRTDVSSNGGAGSGDDFFIGPRELVADFLGNTAYVNDRNAVYSVNLTTGARTIISDDNTGAGDDFQTLTGIVMDGAQLVVGDEGTRRIVGVDVTTGNRTTLSSDSVGTGPEFDRVVDVENHGTAGRIYACDEEHKVFDIALGTGNRSLVFDDRIGVGVDLTDRFPGDVAYDPLTGALFAMIRDTSLNAQILRINPVNGERLLFSGPGVRSGPIFGGFGPIAIDAAGRRLFIYDWDTEALYAVDLNDGDRSLISQAGARGAGPSIPSAMDLLFDPVDGTVLLISSNQDHIVEIDPTTGNRTTLSDNSGGFGPAFSVPNAMTLDLASNRILVLDNGFPRTLYAVNRTTGVRTVVTDSTLGTGTFPGGSAIHLDAANNRVLLLRDQVANASSPTTNVDVTGIDLTTGNRTVLSSIDVGVGPNPISPRAADYDPVTHRLFAPDTRFDAVYVYDTSNPLVFDRAVLTR